MALIDQLARLERRFLEIESLLQQPSISGMPLNLENSAKSIPSSVKQSLRFAPLNPSKNKSPTQKSWLPKQVQTL